MESPVLARQTMHFQEEKVIFQVNWALRKFCNQVAAAKPGSGSPKTGGSILTEEKCLP